MPDKEMDRLSFFGRTALPRRICLAWRRLPSLLCRRFPNLPAVARGAGLEAGDTAGLETCGTQTGQFCAKQIRSSALPGRRGGLS
jgi:hypothetical protein